MGSEVRIVLSRGQGIEVANSVGGSTLDVVDLVLLLFLPLFEVAPKPLELFFFEEKQFLKSSVLFDFFIKELFSFFVIVVYFFEFNF